MAKSARARDRDLRKLFGISQLQYEKLEAEQNMVCFICQGRDSYSKHLAVDHCHSSGSVRGLLCRDCNRALGQFRDKIDSLRRAIIYLERQPPDLGSPEPPAPHKPHNERARYLCKVTTPDGDFPSYKHAGEHYGVHPTTIREWCVGKKNNRPGFESTKGFGAIGAKND